MSAPTVALLAREGVDRPWQRRFLAHAQRCRLGANVTRCSLCRWFDSEARVESYQPISSKGGHSHEGRGNARQATPGVQRQDFGKGLRSPATAAAHATTPDTSRAARRH